MPSMSSQLSLRHYRHRLLSHSHDHAQRVITRQGAALLLAGFAKLLPNGVRLA